MPIYAVRWPNMTLSVIEAFDKNDLFEKIDEIEDPICVTFKKLSKPLFFNLNTKNSSDEDIPKVPEPETSATQKMADIMSDEEFFDITVRVEDGTTFKCHRVVLASCQYFRKLLRSEKTNSNNSVISLPLVNAKVFELVREYLYVGTVNWSHKKNIPFLFNMLRYSHLIGLKQLEEKAIGRIKSCLKHQGWGSSNEKVTNIKDAVEAIKLARSLQLSAFSEKLEKWLFDKIKNIRIDDEIAFISNELEKYDEDLAGEFSKKKTVAIALQKFRNVLGNLECKDFPKIVKAEIEQLEKEKMLDKISFCPYRVLISNLARFQKPRAVLESRCCQVIKFLSEGGIPIDEEKEWDYTWVSLFQSGALHLAATCGLVEIVKTLLELGADPLGKAKPININGETVIHEIHRRLTRTESGSGLKSAYLGRDRDISKNLKKRMNKALDIMLKHVNCTNISQVPYAPFDFEFDANPAYVKKLTDDIHEGSLSLDFVMDPITHNESASDFQEELAGVLYPRLGRLAKEIDDGLWISDNRPDYESLKKKVEVALKQEEIEATRVTVSCEEMKRFHGSESDDTMDWSSDDGF